MPRFHFHIEDGKSIRDRSGTVLADKDAARREAIRLAGRLLVDHADEFWATGEWKVIVTDADQQTLFSLSFRAIDGPDGGQRPRS